MWGGSGVRWGWEWCEVERGGRGGRWGGVGGV